MNPENHYRYKIIDLLISKNANFALYRLPGDNEIHFIMQQHSPETFSDLLALNNKTGFVIAPFSISKASPVIFINPDIKLKGENDIFDYLETYLEKNTNGNNKKPAVDDHIKTESDTFARYENKFNIFHRELEKDEIKKLVLSRTLNIAKKKVFSPAITFRKACDKYSSNFIFLCNTDLSGTWFGCSPESLISGESNSWKTDALAGTMDSSETESDILWDDKNRLEQNIVAEYMMSQLQKAGLDAECSEPKTIRSGNLIHLRSELKFRTDGNINIGNVLSLLHPSPAVCGFPKEEAFKFILENEGYDRTFYSGFLGYLDTKQKTDLFVNLRCMQIFDDRLKLFAGGGILTSSELVSEWEETEHKLQTILSII